MHGVTAVTLASSLSDIDAEIEARVRDVAGNETVVRRMVGWLLNTPPPPPPGSDGGTGEATAGSGEGGCGCSTNSSATTPSLLSLLGLGFVVGRPRRRTRRTERAAP